MNAFTKAATETACVYADAAAASLASVRNYTNQPSAQLLLIAQAKASLTEAETALKSAIVKAVA